MARASPHGSLGELGRIGGIAQRQVGVAKPLRRLDGGPRCGRTSRASGPPGG
jgi:hypothetical protein